MSKIHVMDEILANKIAAGEVVERCVSIVKELVENSIDAKSSIIKIDLLNSGIEEIKVTDNGCGMSKDDALLSFSRHATSKLLNDEDLFNISSLGFRGEALPSIASVSNISLRTSTGDIGTHIVIEGGKLILNENSDSRIGTEIIVRKLFYNTPARLKHLSSLYTELSNIVDFVNKISLSYPNISFTLTNDNKKILYTDGSNNLLKVINSIYGINVTKKMIEVSNSDNEYSVYGYISMPEVLKSNRNNIITIVNGRIVKNMEINRCINDSYHTYKPDDKYPIVILKIDVDTSLVDVNIHPTKQDIKFSKLDELKALIESTIKSSLNKTRLIPKIEIESIDNINVPLNNTSDIVIKDVANNKQEKYEELTLDLSVNEDDSNYNDSISDTNDSYIETIEQEKVPMLYPVGLVKGTYIICQNELGMYLIDQHAAQERINYEYYYYSINNNSDMIDMIIPLNIELPYNEFIIVKENLDILKDMHFSIEEFGINSFIIRGHPIWLPKGNEEVAIRKIIDLIVIKEKNFDRLKFNDRVAMTVSCKASVKANNNISMSEMEELITKLRNCNNPYTCPHGRPTIIFYSNYELEKLFKRAM